MFFFKSSTGTADAHRGLAIFIWPFNVLTDQTEKKHWRFVDTGILNE